MAATGTPPPAAAGCNPRVAAGLPGLFGRPELADCCVVFVLEQPTPASAHRPASPRRHQQASAAAAAAVAGPAATSCQRKAGAEDAPPRSAGHQPLTLPAHSVVLSLASERFAAQHPQPQQQQQQQQQQLGLPPPRPPQRLLPELRVPLGSEAELPAARAAIRFAYTGQIEPGCSLREALELRLVADYLQVEGCAEACLAAVRRLLQLPGQQAEGDAAKQGEPAAVAAAAAAATAAAVAVAAATPPLLPRQLAVQAFLGQARAPAGLADSAGSTQPDRFAAAASGSAGAAATPPPVLALYGCAALWPDPEQDAAFAALLAEVRRQLVAHFGDALAVLNTEVLYEQMLSLPAVGLEALLESDEFGTDSESSVLLMLADRSHNSCHTTAASPSPSPNSPTAAEPSLNRPPDDGWFPITTEDATCLNTYASATEAERKALTSGGTLGMCQPMRRWPPAWLSTPPRRQCLPDSGGRAFAFSAGLQQLEEAFGGIKPGAVGELYPRVCGTPCGCVKAQGLVWGPELQCAPALVGSAAAPAAGCFVFTQVPDVFRGLLLQPAPGAGVMASRMSRSRATADPAAGRNSFPPSL
eukprot:XP_001696309.1 predicted protein [Chlamydomonas reinhardtii]